MNAPSDPVPEDARAAPDQTERDAAAVAAGLASARGRRRVSFLVRWALVPVMLALFVIGVLTPIVPQTIFLVVALVLMAPELPPARRGATWLMRKVPLVRRTIPRRWRRTKDGPR